MTILLTIVIELTYFIRVTKPRCVCLRLRTYRLPVAKSQVVGRLYRPCRARFPRYEITAHFLLWYDRNLPHFAKGEHTTRAKGGKGTGTDYFGSHENGGMIDFASSPLNLLRNLKGCH